MFKKINFHYFSFLSVFFIIFIFCLKIVLGAETNLAPGRELAKQATKSKKFWITADHSKFPQLKKKFTKGPEVTKTCLSCHTEAASQFHKTIHWTWADSSKKGIKAQLGKRGLSVNNF